MAERNSFRWLAFLAFLNALVLNISATGASTLNARALNPNQAPFKNGHWVDIWATMPQLTEPGNLPPAPYNSGTVVFPDTTLRQTIQLSLPAGNLRLRFSNAFGLTDLTISSVTIALPVNGTAGVGSIVPSTLKQVTFNDGSAGIVVAKGALAVSDPISFNIAKPQTVVTITTYFAQGQTGGAITGHPGSRTTSWLSFGDHVSAANVDSASTAHWYYLSAIEAWLPKSSSSFSIIGDSITDGRGSTTDQNNRWPDQLLTRLQSSQIKRISKTLSNIAIANQAAGGNRILADGLGPNVLSRVERDALSHSGVKYVLIYEGVNDIGTAATDAKTQEAVGDAVIAAYKQIIARVHAVGLPIFGATITPFSAPPEQSAIQPYSHPEREKTRQRVNEWIRKSGRFDAVVDFDKIVRSPKNASLLADEYNTGDYLHLNPEGYKAFANGFPVEIFLKFEDGVTGWI